MNRLSDRWERNSLLITQQKALMVIPGRNGITRWLGSSCPDSTGNFSSKECLKNTRDNHYQLNMLYVLCTILSHYIIVAKPHSIINSYFVIIINYDLLLKKKNSLIILFVTRKVHYISSFLEFYEINYKIRTLFQLSFFNHSCNLLENRKICYIVCKLLWLSYLTRSLWWYTP